MSLQVCTKAVSLLMSLQVCTKAVSPLVSLQVFTKLVSLLVSVTHGLPEDILKWRIDTGIIFFFLVIGGALSKTT